MLTVFSRVLEKAQEENMTQRLRVTDHYDRRRDP